MRAILALLVIAASVTPSFADPGQLTIVDAKHGRYRGWDAQDETGRKLEPDEFYLRVGRPDLVEARAHRAMLSTAGIALGMGLIVGGIVVSRTSAMHNEAVGATVGVGIVGGIVLLGTGAYYSYHPEVLSEDDAKRLAAGYNYTHVAPLADRHGGGLMVAGTF